MDVLNRKDGMELRKLTKEQVKDVYNERMKFDFPRSELKPLEMIYKGMDNDYYECLGLYEDDKLIGYDFMVKHEKDYLVDYIATLPELRNKGLGARLLELIAEYTPEADTIIGEVEDPDYTKDADMKNLQARRLGFYLRNGILDTGVKAVCFGVHFKILEMNMGMKHSEEHIRELYRMHYKMLLPPKMYEENIVVL